MLSIFALIMCQHNYMYKYDSYPRQRERCINLDVYVFISYKNGVSKKMKNK